LTEIKILAAITAIPEYAFNGCSSLVSVTLPDSLTSIGTYAFYNCTSLASVIIPASVTSIESYVFNGCSSLTEIKILAAITAIPEYAFNGCSSLVSVTLPDSLTSIGNYAFQSCTSLTDIILPDSVTTLGYYIFNGCTSLKSINYPASLSSCSRAAAYNYNGPFAGSSIETVTIPDGVTAIPANAFCGCSSLVSVTFPDSVTSIGTYAFYNCTSLVSVTIPASVTSIGTYVFYNCTGLASVTLPDSLTSIGTYAFYNCTGLASVTLPDSLTSIDSYAFQNCSSLTEITIPAGVTAIPDSAFAGCTSLESVTLPDSLTSIGASAFSGCVSLTNVIIPSGVVSISRHAFYACSSLKTVTIPGSVINIGEYAFYGSSLTDVYYAYSEYDWKEIEIGSYNKFDNEGVTIHYNCEITFTWAEDYSTCTATYVMNGEEKTVECTVTSSNKAASCTEDGKTIYSASFTITNSDGVETTYTDPKEVITAQATGHTYGEPKFNWNDDHTECTATFTCTKEDDTQSVECEEITTDTTDATCTEDGSTVYTATCTFDEKEYTGTDTIVIPATGHTEVSVGRVESTCTEKEHESGTYCSVCGEVLSGYTVLPATGHSYTYECSWAEKYTSCIFTFICGNCGDEQEVTDSDVTRTVVTEPTCTEAGKAECAASVTFDGKEYTATETETLSALGHSYGEPTFTWSDDYSTCTAEFTCAVCDDIEEVDCVVTSKMTAATCETDGQTVYTATVEFNSTTYSDTQTEVIEKTGHSYPRAEFTWAEDYSSATAVLTCKWCGNIVKLDCTVNPVTKKATCTEDGEIVYTAKAVHEGTTYTDIKTVVLEATGHSYGEPTFVWSENYSTCVAKFTCTQGDDTQDEECTVTSEVTQKATCTENGTVQYTATVTFEDETYTDIVPGILTAVGHTAGAPVVENEVAAACTEDGSYDTVVYCTVCGKEISRETVTIPATGHSYEAVVTAPTCTEGGYTTYTCTVCGNSYTADETEALGHTTELQNAKEATCTENGYTGDEVCTVCGTVVTSGEIIPVTGHSYKAVVTEPTCTEKGYTTYTCTVCGHSYVDDYTEATGHDYEAVVTAPTCT
ncbi:MAG: leucine-rich repeat domain-containing protein, partial [Lachnospiraceae bacterium]|nr:leucine-rich repeat domain-containing protein [Lachnospiraceae bacterium]